TWRTVDVRLDRIRDRRRTLIELEDLPADPRLMEKRCQGGSDVLAGDLVVRLCRTKGNPSDPGAIDEQRWPKDQPVEVTGADGDIDKLLDCEVELLVVVEILPASRFGKHRDQREATHTGEPCRLESLHHAVTIDGGGDLPRTAVR